MTVFVIVSVAVALLLDVANGWHDAQKTMGIITAVLVAGNLMSSGPRGALPSIQARLWAWARLGDYPRCAGESPAAWYGPGS